MSIKDETTNNDEHATNCCNYAEYIATLNRKLSAIPNNRKLLTSSIPTLAEARARIVIIDRFPGSIGSLRWEQNFFDIQDDFNVPTLFDRDEKWHKVRAQLDKAMNDNSDDTWYINFCSGASAGAYPNDVAGYVNWRVQDYIESFGPHYRLGIVIFDFPNKRDLAAVIYSSFYPQAMADTLQYVPDPSSTT